MKHRHRITLAVAAILLVSGWCVMELTKLDIHFLFRSGDADLIWHGWYEQVMEGAMTDAEVWDATERMAETSYRARYVAGALMLVAGATLIPFGIPGMVIVRRT